ncbi:TATA element modulatory factor 1 TATA binding-domain-containing protein [Gongronella butleri]|nr:TATA element modulatory factor 1 TATA binding-domain-containing protein [Gongronella butleri]
MLTRLQELEKTASTLREKATHSDKEATQHKNRVRQLESEAEEAAAVKAKLTTEIASLQHELMQQQEATKVLQARLDEWQANEGQATEAIKKQYQKLMRERLQEEKKKLLDEHQAIRLQASLRQMENQLNFYQTQLQSTTQSRDELADEVTKMTIDMDKLRNEYKQLKATLKDTADLEHRHQAALELLGERTEQVEELKADIADVKDLYRTQVVELVQKIDQLTKANAAANATS